MQIVFAGKAHPRTRPGSITCSRCIAAQSTRIRRQDCVRDDYGPPRRPFLVQGCDVWMNNPRKPLEASGHAA